MSNAVAMRGSKAPAPATVESVVIRGDLSGLTEPQRLEYYQAVCKSVGLNPLTQPFSYIVLNGKLVLYANRNATDQLRMVHNVSVVDMSEQQRDDGVYVVTCKVTNGDGRTDMAKGAVSLGRLQGEALANALMKAETKAKRRATLSICGLSMLDETEIEDIPPERRQNPHVNRPEDIVGEEAPDERSILPDGDPKIKPLPKTATRAEFSRAQNELYQIKSVRELEEWCDKNKDRFQIFHEDHKKILRGLIRAHRETLPQIVTEQRDGYKLSTTQEASDVPSDPEQFLKWCDAQLAAVTDPSLLEPTWTHKIEPWLDVLLPPDVEEAQGIYRKHEQRLS